MLKHPPPLMGKAVLHRMKTSWMSHSFQPSLWTCFATVGRAPKLHLFPSHSSAFPPLSWSFFPAETCGSAAPAANIDAHWCPLTILCSSWTPKCKTHGCCYLKEPASPGLSLGLGFQKKNTWAGKDWDWPGSWTHKEWIKHQLMLVWCSSLASWWASSLKKRPKPEFRQLFC